MFYNFSLIQVLKLYAWEQSFIAKVLNLRKLELKQLKYGKYLFSALLFTFSCAPFAVSDFCSAG